MKGKNVLLQDSLYFERNEDNLYKNIFGLWKIEGDDIKVGGKVQWANSVRFKNLR